MWRPQARKKSCPAGVSNAFGIHPQFKGPTEKGKVKKGKGIIETAQGSHFSLVVETSHGCCSRACNETSLKWKGKQQLLASLVEGKNPLIFINQLLSLQGNLNKRSGGQQAARQFSVQERKCYPNAWQTKTQPKTLCENKKKGSLFSLALETNPWSKPSFCCAKQVLCREREGFKGTGTGCNPPKKCTSS